MTRVPTFAEYAELYAGELGIRLEPFQRRLLEDLAQPQAERPTLLEAHYAGRRAHRRWVQAVSLAAAALHGEPVTVVSTDQAAARDLYASAIRELERYGSAFGLDVQPARELLEDATARTAR